MGKKRSGGENKRKRGKGKDRGRFSVFGVEAKLQAATQNSKDREPSPVFLSGYNPVCNNFTGNLLR